MKKTNYVKDHDLFILNTVYRLLLIERDKEIESLRNKYENN